MTKGRPVPAQPAPPLDPKRLENEERKAALLSLDPSLIRVYAARWIPSELNTTALADDAELIRSAHAAIMRDESMPPQRRLASAIVLASEGDETARAMLAELKQEGP